jgi:hypothetical protein
MPSCTTHTRSSTFAALAAVAFLLTGCAFLLNGCATPGPPKPPTLNLPKAVTDLAAERIANTVVLHWSTPEKNTDNLNLNVKAPIFAEICRETGSEASAAKPTCTPVLKFGVKPGPTQFVDTLPAPLAAGPARLLVYRVRILNAAGRFVALSAPAFSAAGAAPSLIANLHATAIPAGVMVEWQPVSSDTGINVELDRTDLDLAKELAAKAAAKPAPPAPQPKPTKSKRNKPASSTSSKPKSGITSSNQPTAEVHLSADGDAGTIDRTARTGDTYTYAAQRVLTVDLDGHHLLLRGEQSPVIALQVRDTFPPAVPVGLAAVPNPVSDTNKQPSIDLSWEPDTDADLAGYLVYRSLGSGEFIRLTPAAITASAYSDIAAAPGQRYSYRVTAIDITGNESKPTPQVQEQLNP